MWLLLTESNDPCAAWLLAGLARRAPGGVEWVTADQLGQARRWEHRVGRSETLSRVELADGRWIDSRAVTATINRLLRLPVALPRRVRGLDQPYAAQEWGALIVSWLAAFAGPMLNPPSPLGLSGAFRHPIEWEALAAQAGFLVPETCHSSEADPRQLGRTSGSRLSKSIPVLVSGLRVQAPGGQALGEDTVRAARLLAALAGAPLLGLQLAPVRDRWQFVSATSWPDLRVGGESLLAALARTLNTESLRYEVAA